MYVFEKMRGDYDMTSEKLSYLLIGLFVYVELALTP